MLSSGWLASYSESVGGALHQQLQFLLFIFVGRVEGRVGWGGAKSLSVSIPGLNTSVFFFNGIRFLLLFYLSPLETMNFTPLHKIVKEGREFIFRYFTGGETSFQMMWNLIIFFTSCHVVKKRKKKKKKKVLAHDLQQFYSIFFSDESPPRFARIAIRQLRYFSGKNKKKKKWGAHGGRATPLPTTVDF